MSSARKSPRRAVLPIVAGLLIASAVLRIGAGSGKAFAKADPPHEPRAEMPAAAEPGACFSEPEMDAVIAELKEREAVIKRQEEEIKVRFATLSAADVEIEKRLQAMKKAEEDLRATIAVVETASEQDIARLVEVYQAMKPKDAAALFETMEPQFAAGFLGRMRPEAAAGIMAGMTPEAAYSVSAVLAGRNARAPKQ